jgi:hypothetical protein
VSAYLTSTTLPSSRLFLSKNALNSEHLSPQSQQHAFFTAFDLVGGGVNNKADINVRL